MSEEEDSWLSMQEGFYWGYMRKRTENYFLASTRNLYGYNNNIPMKPSRERTIKIKR